MQRIVDKIVELLLDGKQLSLPKVYEAVRKQQQKPEVVGSGYELSFHYATNSSDSTHSTAIDWSHIDPKLIDAIKECNKQGIKITAKCLLTMMNVPGLTRAQVQYRLSRWRKQRRAEARAQQNKNNLSNDSNSRATSDTANNDTSNGRGVLSGDDLASTYYWFGGEQSRDDDDNDNIAAVMGRDQIISTRADDNVTDAHAPTRWLMPSSLSSHARATTGASFSPANQTSSSSSSTRTTRKRKQARNTRARARTTRRKTNKSHTETTQVLASGAVVPKPPPFALSRRSQRLSSRHVTTPPSPDTLTPLDLTLDALPLSTTSNGEIVPLLSDEPAHNSFLTLDTPFPAEFESLADLLKPFE